jgi:hypothetical protein
VRIDSTRGVSSLAAPSLVSLNPTSVLAVHEAPVLLTVVGNAFLLSGGLSLTFGEFSVPASATYFVNSSYAVFSVPNAAFSSYRLGADLLVAATNDDGQHWSNSLPFAVRPARLEFEETFGSPLQPPSPSYDPSAWTSMHCVPEASSYDGSGLVCTQGDTATTRDLFLPLGGELSLFHMESASSCVLSVSMSQDGGAAWTQLWSGTAINAFTPVSVSVPAVAQGYRTRLQLKLGSCSLSSSQSHIDSVRVHANGGSAPLRVPVLEAASPDYAIGDFSFGTGFRVTLIGRDFLPSAHLRVLFGSLEIPASSAYFIDDHLLEVPVPDASASAYATGATVSVTATNDGVSWSDPVSFTFYATTPVFTANFDPSVPSDWSSLSCTSDASSFSGTGLSCSSSQSAVTRNISMPSSGFLRLQYFDGGCTLVVSVSRDGGVTWSKLAAVSNGLRFTPLAVGIPAPSDSRQSWVRVKFSTSSCSLSTSRSYFDSIEVHAAPADPCAINHGGCAAEAYCFSGLETASCQCKPVGAA